MVDMPSNLTKPQINKNSNLMEPLINKKKKIYQKYFMKIASNIYAGKCHLLRGMCLSCLAQIVNSW